MHSARLIILSFTHGCPFCLELASESRCMMMLDQVRNGGVYGYSLKQLYRSTVGAVPGCIFMYSGICFVINTCTNYFY